MISLLGLTVLFLAALVTQVVYCAVAATRKGRDGFLWGIVTVVWSLLAAAFIAFPVGAATVAVLNSPTNRPVHVVVLCAGTALAFVPALFVTLLRDVRRSRRARGSPRSRSPIRRSA